MGKLYICGTPIGNLEDVSIRLLKTLRRVDMIACEDTRHTIKLLNKYKIKNRLISYHQHSSRGKEDYILEQLKSGQEVALVSDAGMPSISDPGEGLVKRVIEADIELELIPGPSALIGALAVSGMDTSAFVFEGFLPSKASQRQEVLTRLKEEKRTIVVYEAPHRLPSALNDMAAILGEERPIVLARELTKKYQEIKRATVGEMAEFFTREVPRGEICLVIGGKTEEEKPADMEQVIKEVEELIKAGIDKKEAFKMKAREYSLKKSDIYKLFINKR